MIHEYPLDSPEAINPIPYGPPILTPRFDVTPHGAIVAITNIYGTYTWDATTSIDYGTLIPAMYHHLSNTNLTFTASTLTNPTTIVEWYWFFGDGTEASGQVVTHTYQANLSDVICHLRVTDNFGNIGWASLNICLNQPLSYKDVVLSDNPVAYWKLDETTGLIATDQLGANNGTYQGGCILNQPPLADGKAVSMDGINDFISVPSSSTIKPSTAASWEFWAQITGGSSGENRIIHVGTGEVLIERFSNGILVRVAGSGPTGVGAWGAGVTRHIVVTFDNVNIRTYIDAVLVDTTAQAGPITYGAPGLKIGSDGVAHFPAGTIDEVAIYNHVLSLDRIQAHFNAA